MLAESDGILSWIIQGAVLWHQSGLQLCPEIKQQIAAYRTESDLLGSFLEEECELDGNSKSIEDVAFKQYQTWTIANGNKPLAKKRFTQKLKERGIAQTKSNGKRFYQGIKLINTNIRLIPT